MRWRPILQGDDAERARSVIDDIVHALQQEDGASLGAYEHACRALLFAYASLRDSALRDSAVRHLDESAGWLEKEGLDESLHGGLTGVAWLAAHVRDCLGDVPDEDPNEDIDQLLAEFLGATPWPHDYDLIRGLVGCGIYALERLPRPSGVICLERVIERLAEEAEPGGAGTTWRSKPAFMIPEVQAEHPEGYFNLGVAHGVPAVIALLGAACHAGVAERTARPLLDGAMRWVLAQRRANEESSFPTWVAPDGRRSPPARSAWCYGDPGVAAALLWAARAVDHTDWEQEALALARTAAARPPEQCRVKDAGLCHGAIGLAHVYNRIYQASGDELFADTARDWLARGLAMRTATGGAAGFRALRPTEGVLGAPLEWYADCSFLTGISGIGLALLSAVEPIEPRWDSLIAASVPPIGMERERAMT